jgi:hypothetical protein
MNSKNDIFVWREYDREKHVYDEKPYSYEKRFHEQITYVVVPKDKLCFHRINMVSQFRMGLEIQINLSSKKEMIKFPPSWKTT